MVETAASRYAHHLILVLICSCAHIFGEGIEECMLVGQSLRMVLCKITVGEHAPDCAAALSSGDWIIRLQGSRTCQYWPKVADGPPIPCASKSSLLGWREGTLLVRCRGSRLQALIPQLPLHTLNLICDILCVTWHPCSAGGLGLQQLL